jgi:hypothetical protein
VNFLDQTENFSVRPRALFIGVTTLVLAGMHFADPIIVSRWLPLPTSCGAITGLPCLFCGMTRALHLVLRGDLAGALYFNWLAFPLLALVTFLVVLFAVEIMQGRRLLNLRTIAPLSGRRLTICILAAIILWSLHAYLAVSQHKRELLNPRGPLYHLFVHY